MRFESMLVQKMHIENTLVLKVWQWIVQTWYQAIALVKYL